MGTRRLFNLAKSRFSAAWAPNGWQAPRPVAAAWSNLDRITITRVGSMDVDNHGVITDFANYP